MKKEKKGLNPHIRNLFLTIVLLIVFFLTVIGSVVFFDILGIINFSKIVPRESALARVPYIGKYVEYSYYQHLDEEERIKETMNKYRNILEERGKQLDLKEQDIALREKELETLQVKLKDMEKVLVEKETKLKTYEEQVNKISSDYNASENNVERFASIYTSMTPEAVAKIALKSNLSTIARIFEKMDNLPKELINQYIGELSNLKTELSKIVIEEVRKELKSTNKTNKISYLREEKDLKRLEENKKKISKLLSVDKNLKISEIAKELNITRQGLYKNQELKNLIDELKKV